MIFTRRFGALRARPTFPDMPEATMEQEIEILLQDAGDGLQDATDDDLRDEPAA